MARLFLVAVILLASGLWTKARADAVSGIDQTPGALVPIDLPLQDAGAGRATIRQLTRGAPFLLVPVLHCPTACGARLADVAAALRGLPREVRERLTLIGLDIDPDEDPARLQVAASALRSRFRGLGGIEVLSGDRPSIAQITDAMGYHYTLGDHAARFDMVAATAVAAPDGYVVRWLFGPAPAASEVGMALDEASAGQIGSIGDQMMLICYHYDPTRGCYALSVPGVLGLGAGASVFLLAGLTGNALRRRRPGASAAGWSWGMRRLTAR